MYAKAIKKIMYICTQSCNKLFYIRRYIGQFIARYRVIYRPIFQISAVFCCKRYDERFPHIISAVGKKEISDNISISQPTRPIFKTWTVTTATVHSSSPIFFTDQSPPFFHRPPRRRLRFLPSLPTSSPPHQTPPPYHFLTVTTSTSSMTRSPLNNILLSPSPSDQILTAPTSTAPRRPSIIVDFSSPTTVPH